MRDGCWYGCSYYTPGTVLVVRGCRNKPSQTSLGPYRPYFDWLQSLLRKNSLRVANAPVIYRKAGLRKLPEGTTNTTTTTTTTPPPFSTRFYVRVCRYNIFLTCPSGGRRGTAAPENIVFLHTHAPLAISEAYVDRGGRAKTKIWFGVTCLGS